MPHPARLEIAQCNPIYLQAFKRINSLLFPIRYPDKFYDQILSDPETASLTRVALWQDDAPANQSKQSRTTAETKTRGVDVPDEARDPRIEASPGDSVTAKASKVVGGIRCRLEDIDPTSESKGPLGTTSSNPLETIVLSRRVLYIQTIGVLAPYRHLGIACALLDHVSRHAFDIYEISAIYAHVWEKNEDALEWYARQGFDVGGEIIPEYYKRLRPSGARIVKKCIGVSQALSWRDEASDQPVFTKPGPEDDPACQAS